MRQNTLLMILGLGLAGLAAYLFLRQHGPTQAQQAAGGGIVVLPSSQPIYGPARPNEPSDLDWAKFGVSNAKNLTSIIGSFI